LVFGDVGGARSEADARERRRWVGRRECIEGFDNYDTPREGGDSVIPDLDMKLWGRREKRWNTGVDI